MAGPWSSYALHATSGAVFFDMKAVLALDVLIIGAGFAGLSAAYSFASSGHRVRVFDSEPSLRKRNYGVCVPQNMGIILKRWGLNTKLGRRCKQWFLRSAYTGEVIGEFSIAKTDAILRTIGHGFYTAHHDDLLQMLHDLAVEAGVQIRFNAHVESIDHAAPTAILSSGETIHADLIVGANGPDSIVRHTLVDLQGGCSITQDPRPSEFASCTFTLPCSEDETDYNNPLRRGGAVSNYWMGSGYFVSTYPIRDGTEFSVTIMVNRQKFVGNVKSVRPLSFEELRLPFDDACPGLKGVLDLGTVRDRTFTIVNDTTLEEWCDDQGHVVLVGRAAQASIPGSVHNPALSVEDGALLGRLFAHLSAPYQRTRLLDAYAELRQARYTQVHEVDSTFGRTCSIPHDAIVDAGPSGTIPAFELRDRSMREQRQKELDTFASGQETSIDAFMANVWDNEVANTYAYDTIDVADTWWTEWGTILQRMGE